MLLTPTWVNEVMRGTHTWLVLPAYFHFREISAYRNYLGYLALACVAISHLMFATPEARLLRISFTFLCAAYLLLEFFTSTTVTYNGLLTRCAAYAWFTRATISRTTTLDDLINHLMFRCSAWVGIMINYVGKIELLLLAALYILHIYSIVRVKSVELHT